MKQINLIPRQTLERMARSKRIRSWTLGLLGYAALLAVAGGTIRLGLRSSAGDVAHQIEIVEASVKNYEMLQARTKTQMTSLRNQIDAARATGRHPNWGIMLDLISQSLSPRTALDVIELRKTKIDPPKDAAKSKEESGAKKSAPAGTRTEFAIVLKGRAVSVEAMGEFLVGLERYKVFRQVKLGDNKRVEMPDGAIIEFDVTCPVESAEPAEHAKGDGT